MSIPIECECGFADKVPDKWAGKRVKCKCGRKILVPQPAAAGNKPSAEQKSNSAKPDPAAAASKTASKKPEPQKPPQKTSTRKPDAGKTSPDDLSELVSGDLPAELKKPKPAIVQSKATTGDKVDDLDLVEEFEELEELDELDELKELPPESGLDDLEELDDDLDDFDMRETDDLDMTEPSVEKPAKKLPEKKLPQKKSAPEKPKPEPTKPAPVKSEQTKPDAKKEQPKPAAKKEQLKPDAKKKQSKPVAKKEQPKPTSEKPVKPISKPVGGNVKQNETAKATSSTKENLDEKRDSVKPAEKTSKESVAKETVTATESKASDAAKVAIPSAKAAPAADRQDAPPPPAHAPAMVKADMATVNITLDGDQPAIVETGAPKLSVGSPGGSSLSGRQKAKRKSDIIRWVVMGVIGVVACGFFGVIFFIGSLLNRFETPAVIPEDQQKAEESADSMLVPGADSTPPAEDKKASTNATDVKEADAKEADAAKADKADTTTEEAAAKAPPPE